MTVELPEIEAVMVLYGEPASARAALESLAASEAVRVRVTLVDHGAAPRATTNTNARRGEQRSLLDAHVPDALLVEGPNRGFGAGVNLGVRRALRDRRPDFVFIMNHDVRVEPTALAALAEHLDGSRAAGAVGPVILSKASPGTVWNAGSDIEWPAARPRSRFHGEPASAVPQEPYSVGYLAGCAILVRPDDFERAGGFAEDYFLYFEDADFAGRLRALGLDSVVVPAARVLHAAGSATDSRPELARFLRVRNRLRFSRRHGRGRFWVALSRLLFRLRKLFGDRLERRAALTGKNSTFNEADHDRSD